MREGGGGVFAGHYGTGTCANMYSQYNMLHPHSWAPPSFPALAVWKAIHA